MKKRVIALLLCGALIGVTGCSSGVSQEEYNKVVEERDELQAQLDALTEESTINKEDSTINEEDENESESDLPSETSEFKVGETWEVEGKFKLTVDSVVATDERNEYDESNPGAVYIITYTYENLGINDTLYISMENTIVDANGTMGGSYPGNVELYPQEVPIGANCQAQACVSVTNPGTFKDYVSVYDDDFNEYTAIFNLEV